MDSDSTKAIAKAVDRGLQILGDQIGGFFGRVVGAPIENAVGLLGADYLAHARMRNLARLQQKTDELLQKRGVKKTRPVPPVIALPLFKDAADETRDELLDLWAQLLACEMDPSRGEIRQDFIETVKRLNPLDAKILREIFARSLDDANRSRHSLAEILADLFEVRLDQAEISILHLERLGCLAEYAHGMLRLTAYGRELLRACGD